MTSPTPAPERDPQVEAFLAVLASRRSPRTVDAYRRDLADLATTLGRPPATATADDVRTWLADIRSRGQAPSTVARRAAAARTFFGHLTLLGVRADHDVTPARAGDPRERVPAVGDSFALFWGEP